MCQQTINWLAVIAFYIHLAKEGHQLNSWQSISFNDACAVTVFSISQKELAHQQNR